MITIENKRSGHRQTITEEKWNKWPKNLKKGYMEVETLPDAPPSPPVKKVERPQPPPPPTREVKEVKEKDKSSK